MNIDMDIIDAFNLKDVTLLSDEHIANNSCPIFDNPGIPQEELIPQYMLWVVKNGDHDGNLICDGLLSDLAFLGRTKNSQLAPFKYNLTGRQLAVVIEFIEWCKSNLVLSDEVVLKRLQKYW
ncbi:hypothetical protein [Gynuella sunshinyii]|uniref:hypothetical protein n=1 Tax=Gynuella sunshinyii TaxID=1445505 RepID=UPI0005CC4158|nr:hypothetical protein [Gynuella sunshinyii]